MALSRLGTSTRPTRNTKEVEFVTETYRRSTITSPCWELVGADAPPFHCRSSVIRARCVHIDSEMIGDKDQETRIPARLLRGHFGRGVHSTVDEMVDGSTHDRFLDVVRGISKYQNLRIQFCQNYIMRNICVRDAPCWDQNSERVKFFEYKL